MHRALARACLLLAAACGPAPPSSGPAAGPAASPPGPGAAPGLDAAPSPLPARVILAFDGPIPPTVDLGAGPVAPIHRLTELPLAVFPLPPGISAGRARARAAALPGVVLAELDQPRVAAAARLAERPPAAGLAWWADPPSPRLAPPRVATARVALLDTGLGAGVELPGTAGADFRGGATGDGDPHGHGTLVGAAIAGSSLPGLLPVLRPLRVLGPDGAGWVSDTLPAIEAAVAAGDGVLLLGYEGDAVSRAEALALGWATERGALVVAPAGNRGLLSAPARLESVLAVGALDARGGPAVYSPASAALDLMAPGGDLSRDDDTDGHPDGVGVWVDGRELRAEGTSLAAARVAGAAAALLAAGASAAEARALLLRTATDLGPPGQDPETGRGRVNLDAALAERGLSAPAPPAGETRSLVVHGLRTKRDGPRLAVTCRTEEDLELRVCDETGRCAVSPRGRQHALLLEAGGQSVLFEGVAADGGRRVLGPLRVGGG